MAVLRGYTVQTNMLLIGNTFRFACRCRPHRLQQRHMYEQRRRGPTTVRKKRGRTGETTAGVGARQCW